MKLLAIAAALTIGGCEVARTVAPHTTAGFEQGGVLGALEGASGVVLATCRTLDGEVVQVAVDGLAFAAGAEDALEAVRAARRRACAAAGAVHVVSDGLAAQAPTVHRGAGAASGAR